MALATKSPDLRVVPDDFAERHRQASLATEPQSKLLDDVLSMAVAHDRICQETQNRLQRLLGITGGDGHVRGIALDSEEHFRIDELLNEHRIEVIELCAIVAEAALRRTSGVLRIFSKTLTQGVISLDDHDLEDLLRPIFRESGIEHRFEVCLGYEVYGL